MTRADFPKGIVNLFAHITCVTMVAASSNRAFDGRRPWSRSRAHHPQIHRLQLMVAFHVEMDDGESAEFGPGDPHERSSRA